MSSTRRSVIEVDALLLDDERPVADLCVDRSDVLAQHAEEEELHRGDAKEADDDRREPNRQPGTQNSSFATKQLNAAVNDATEATNPIIVATRSGILE